MFIARVQPHRLMSLSELRELLEMLLKESDVEVLEVRRADADSPPSPPPEARTSVRNPLTPAERRVLRALTRFDKVEEIAEHLRLSKHTIEKHIENIMRKLKVGSRPRLVYRAMVLGYLR